MSYNTIPVNLQVLTDDINRIVLGLSDQTLQERAQELARTLRNSNANDGEVPYDEIQKVLELTKTVLELRCKEQELAKITAETEKLQAEKEKLITEEQKLKAETAHFKWKNSATLILAALLALIAIVIRNK